MPKKRACAANLGHLRSPSDEFRTAHVPTEVLESVATLNVTEKEFRDAPILAARAICQRGGARHHCAIRFLEGEALQRSASSSLDSSRFGTELLVECSLFYHSIGHNSHGIRLLKLALLEAQQFGDVNILRRLHNCLGALYASRCDFERSFDHLEKSLNLAKQLRNPLYTLASLANTVAALDIMGFLEDAKTLALEITKQPEGTEELDCIHLINANNAIRICHALNDHAAARIFYEISSIKANASNSLVSDVTRAHFESARVTHLIALGKPELALTFINEAIAASFNSKGTRSISVLYCAQALAHIALANKREMERSKIVLTELLAQGNDSSDLREELLKVLIKLHSSDRTSQAKRQTLIYLRRLREHVVAVKFGHLIFEDAIKSSSSNRLEGEMHVSPYPLPRWIEAACRVPDMHSATGGLPTVNDQLNAIEIATVEVTDHKSEPKLRTSQYQIAECWAVAAEFTAEGSSSHCFGVGKLAGLIANQLGWTVRKCLALELACRLHDIGKLSRALNQRESGTLRSYNQFGIMYEHTMFGERLLSGSSDQTLQLAARISKSHHEWWNGCGVPSSLAGTAIAIEGRICAVADAFLTLVSPPPGQVGWTVKRAFQQVICLSGVQLDPDLVRALGCVLEETNAVADAVHLPSAQVGRKKQLAAKSREKLCRALEIVV